MDRERFFGDHPWRCFFTGMLSMLLIIGLGISINWGDLSGFGDRVGAVTDAITTDPTTTVPAPVGP